MVEDEDDVEGKEISISLERVAADEVATVGVIADEVADEVAEAADVVVKGEDLVAEDHVVIDQVIAEGEAEDVNHSGDRSAVLRIFVHSYGVV